jgi:hypothetical protein
VLQASQWPPSAVHDTVEAIARGIEYRRSIRQSLLDRAFLWIAQGVERLVDFFRHLPASRAIGLTVLGVNLDTEPGRAAALAGAAGIGFPVLLDQAQDVSRTYRADDLPLIVLIDRHGAIRARHQALDERDERGLLVDLRDLIDE